MKRNLAAILLLAATPALTYTALCPIAAHERFASTLAIIALAGALSGLLAWRLLRRASGLEAELEAERQRNRAFEARSREMCRALERKLEQRSAEMARRRDTLVRTEKLASLSRLVGGVAHELNNPLTAIMGEATILAQRCTQPELRRGLRIIEQQAARCAGLIRDLAAFASLEQSKVQPLDVHALLEGALAQAALAAPAQEVSVVRQYWPEPLVVTGNMEQLQQALVNVLSNAYQAMASASPALLTLRTQPTDDGCVRLEVADSGSGIEPAALPYIFDPFFSQRPPPLGPSVGMGLSVALGLLQAHGGRIWVESELGIGTAVFVELLRSDAQG